MRLARAAAAVALLLSATTVAAQQRADAVLIVNSASTHYVDAQTRIRPYLDHLGVPYAVLDLATTAVGADVGSYALIVIGHTGLDTAGRYLDATEQANLSAAVRQGAGLVNFDYDLAVNGVGRYAYVQDVFGFGYGTATTGAGVTFEVGAPNHFISSRHAAADYVRTASVPTASLVPSSSGTVLAHWEDTGYPVIVAATYGQGRAVQLASYAWMLPANRGPLGGLDDLVWRSFAWAARKPFVMQGLPPFLAVRVDDVIGPLWWVRTANDLHLKPWLGLFYQSMTAANATDLATLVNAGGATAAVHAKGNDFFYYDHFNQRDLPDATVAANYQDATAWHAQYGIPISTYVAPHWYEIGTNAFAGLASWGVRSVGTHMVPGQPYGAPWLNLGPFRLYDSGASDGNAAVTYADYLPIPNHPEYQDRFFECVTEIRDDAGYEWYPDATDVAGTIGRGTRQAKRALDAMALAILFTHEPYILSFTTSDWRAALTGIESNLSAYAPVYVTMDDACEYLRAKHDTRISAAVYDPATQVLTTDLSGAAGVPTQFLVFTDSGGTTLQRSAGVPAFSGATRVTQALTGTLPTLASIAVTPATASLVVGATRQLAATGTYTDGTTRDLTSQVAWASSSPGVLTVSAGGLVTAVAAGSATATATLGTIAGTAALTVTAAPLTVTTASLPGALVGAAYSTTLVASGGTPPYAWSMASGALPAGLGLSGAVISGTPTVAGTASFVVRVIDAAGGAATAGLSITVLSSAGALSIWPASAVPGTPDRGADGAIELGVKFTSDVSGAVQGIRFYKSSLNTGTHVGSLWSAGGARLASAIFTAETASGWQQVTFASPVPITAGTVYVASYHTDVGHYARDLNYFASAGYDAAPLHAPASAAAGGNGVYAYGAEGTFPNGTALDANYWVDVVFVASAPATLASVAVTPSTASIGVGATAAFAATGTYSDGTTRDLTGQATWTSSAPGVATVSSAGVATGVAAGATTISASMGAVTGVASLTVTAPPPTLAAVAVAVAAVPEGGATTGTVTLSGPAPAAVTVALASSAPAVAVPASVTVPAGAAAATFQVTSSAVTATTAATLTATLGGDARTASLTVAALTLSISPSSVVGGGGATGTLTSSAALPAAVTFPLGSSSAAATVPASVTLAAGATSTTFAVSTTVVAATTSVTVTATSGGVLHTAPLTVVTAAALSALAVAPAAVVEGDGATGTVTLSAAAGAAGVVVTLSSSSGAALVPASVTVPAGATSAPFAITTAAVSAGTTATLTATYAGVSRTATLGVRAATLSLSPTTVGGGNGSTATVRLSAAVTAPATFTLTTSNAAVATVPASVTLAAGATTATFVVATTRVTGNTSVTVTATHAGIAASATLSVRPIVPSALALSPSTVVGGNPSTGTVTLNYAAPAGGTVVTLTSSRTAAATVPAAVTVPAGATSATFTITTYHQTARTSSKISAAAGGTTRTATLTVTP